MKNLRENEGTLSTSLREEGTEDFDFLVRAITYRLFVKALINLHTKDRTKKNEKREVMQEIKNILVTYPSSEQLKRSGEVIFSIIEKKTSYFYSPSEFFSRGEPNLVKIQRNQYSLNEHKLEEAKSYIAESGTMFEIFSSIMNEVSSEHF